MTVMTYKTPPVMHQEDKKQGDMTEGLCAQCVKHSLLLYSQMKTMYNHHHNRETSHLKTKSDTSAAILHTLHVRHCNTISQYHQLGTTARELVQHER